MAHDQALLESVAAGAPPVLRFYRWAPACLSLGRNQVVPSREEVAAAAAARGLDLVRRATGGAAVLHDRELTYSVAVPVGVLGSPRETYVAINHALVAGLRRLGVVAEVAGGGERRSRADEAVHQAMSGGHIHTVTGVAAGASYPAGRANADSADLNHSADPDNGPSARTTWDNPCFQASAPGEVVVGGLKLIGSAQCREGRTLLQHGSLLLAGDQEVVAECLAGELGPGGEGQAQGERGRAPGTLTAPASGFTTLAALLNPLPSWPELVAALSAGFAETLGITLQPSDLTPTERARIVPLAAHFESPAWTWRR
jgi:lipoate-protein ligase A